MPRQKFNVHEFLNPDLNADPNLILTTKNRSLKQLQNEQKEKEDLADKLRDDIKRFVDVVPDDIADLATFHFIIAHFSTQCKSHDGKVVPAEGAMLSMSISQGITGDFHAFLEPGDIPCGYRSECMAKGRKTHNIPIDAEDEFYTKDRLVFDQLLELINRSSAEVVFCLEDEVQDVKDVLELMLEKRTNHQAQAPQVFPLEELMYFMDESLKRAFKAQNKAKDKKHFFFKDKEAAGAHLQNETERFKFQVPSCTFHEETGRVEYCSQAKMRQRAFIIMDRYCDLLNVPMVDLVHVPKGRQSRVSKNKELDESYRGFALKSAEVSIRFKKNGVTEELPLDRDPMTILMNSSVNSSAANRIGLDDTSTTTEEKLSTLYEDETTDLDP
eukprot:00396.XXX_967_2436_1 [CDS] Oithona nana genome sequencing.